MMDKASYQFFRLRQDQTIVGYMRFTKPGDAYFSKDKFWWKAAPIDYDLKDVYVERDDMNQQWLFEYDIVEMKPIDSSEKALTAVLLFDDKLLDFVAVNVTNWERIPRSNWDKYRWKLSSYLFINSDLQHQLTDQGWTLS